MVHTELCEALTFWGSFRLKTGTNTVDLNDMFPTFLADIDTALLTSIVTFSVSISLNEVINVPRKKTHLINFLAL